MRILNRRRDPAIMPSGKGIGAYLNNLSPHDMFLWRISDPGNPRVISRRALTKEQEEKEAEVNRQFEQLLQEKFGDSGG